jgi:DHA3 family macrolide efflux protein-like MFS transporter
MDRPAWILVAGQFVSVIGDGLASVAVLWWVLQSTGSVALMASVAAILAVAGLAVSPFAGVWVDRLDRRGLMMAADAARALCYGAIAALAASGRLQVWVLVVLLAISRAIGAAYFPALMSALPRLVPQERLPRINGMLSFAQSTGGMIGAAVGGLLIAAFGVAAALGADAASFLVSAASLALIAIPAERALAATDFRSQMLGGLRYVRENPLLRALAGPSLITNAMTNAAMVLLPALAAGPLHAGAQGYGLLYASFPLGTVVASAAISVWGRSASRAWTLYALLVVMGAALGVVGLSRSLGVGLAAMAVAGAGGAVANAAVYSLLQSGVPEEFQGRVFSLLGGVSQGLTPISQATAGAAAAAWSVGGVIAACGAGVVATGLGFCWTGAAPVDAAFAAAGLGPREVGG